MQYNEGQQAWFDNKITNDNPYVTASVKHQDWYRGYKDAEWKYNYQTEG